MADGISSYRIWAPDNAAWSEWAKPVLFASAAPTLLNSPPEPPEPEWAKSLGRGTAIIVDLPGQDGVLEGLALTKAGFRPVPLYNGVKGPGSAMLVDVSGIIAALFGGAKTLYKTKLPINAPPAFLLDSNRLNGLGKQPGKFDNRWCIFPQDMPSAAYMTRNGISTVVVRSDKVRDDLSHILFRYQKQGIKVHLCTGSPSIYMTNVKRPSSFKSLMYRFMVIAGLTRNAAGGFGGMIPEPMESDSGSGYHGIG